MGNNKSGLTRQRIVEAAVEVFAEREFQEATMRDIARKLGISAGNIYQYFDSKESIVFYILAEQIKGLKASMQEQLLGIRGTHNKLRKFAWHYLRCHEEHRELSWLEYISVNIKAWYEVAPVWDLSMGVVGMFSDILKEGIKDGDVRPDVNIRIAGHMFFGGIRGAVIFWLMGKQFGNLTEEVADAIADYTYEIVRIPGVPSKCPLLEKKKTAIKPTRIKLKSA